MSESESALILDPQAAPGGDVRIPAPTPVKDRPAIPLAPVGPDGLDAYVRRNLRKEEIAIARQFHGGATWIYPLVAIVCFAVWLSFFPLAIMGMLNLPLAFVLSCIFATGGYVTSHEAMHSNIARQGEKLRWLNELTGQISTIPIVFPFSMARMMHLEHHYHCNDPQKDPD